MLKLSKIFVIFLFLSVAISYGFKDPWIGVQIMVYFIIVRIVWKFFTK